MDEIVNASRGRRGGSYHLITPANHFAARLPFLPNVPVIKLATPRAAPCRFGWYLLQLPGGSATEQPIGDGYEHFVFVVDGTVEVNGDRLDSGAFAFVPDGGHLDLRVDADAARLIWVQRRYEPVAGVHPPTPCTGSTELMSPMPTSVPGLTRLDLLPKDDPAFDFNMSILAFEAGVALPKVEVHDEEHGLYMLGGAGTYHLDGDDLDVTEDDFIYMAPYCPQFFRATRASAYLLYKDTFRDGFEFADRTDASTA